MTDQPYIVYTYEAGADPFCHAYGPADKAAADLTAQNLTSSAFADGRKLTAMSVPLESMPV